MTRRQIRRTWFVYLAGGWAMLLLPVLVFTQGAGSQAHTHQGQTPPPPPPPPPPPTPVPMTIQIIRGAAGLPPQVVRVEPGRGRGRRLTDLTMPVPADNPMTAAKIALGKRLFFDPILSIDKSVSCGTCHLPDRGFADDKPLAVGVFGRVGKRNSPAVVNRGFGRAHFWDSRAATLEAQVLQPISDPNEMDLAVDVAVARLTADPSYRDEFAIVFGRPIAAADLGAALATFLRSIRSGDSRYDRFAAGDATALTAEQQQGLQIFRGKGRCFFCHVEPLFTDETLHNTGVAWNPVTATFQDDGRFQVTKQERDRGKFKTPTLREIALTAPYMHDGSLETLADVVDFYNDGGRRNPQLVPLIRPIGLTPPEKQALIAFLESLSGSAAK